MYFVCIKTLKIQFQFICSNTISMSAHKEAWTQFCMLRNACSAILKQHQLQPASGGRRKLAENWSCSTPEFVEINAYSYTKPQTCVPKPQTNFVWNTQAVSLNQSCQKEWTTLTLLDSSKHESSEADQERVYLANITCVLLKHITIPSWKRHRVKRVENQTPHKFGGFSNRKKS